MSKWGIEEKETLNAINKIGFKGKILNIAAGDGRFNEELLKVANEVVAIDINENELKELESKCPEELRYKLNTKIIEGNFLIIAGECRDRILEEEGR